MLNFALLLEGLKSLPAPADISAPLSHCQLLDVKARQLNFNNYHHFRQILKKAPEDEFVEIATALLREICAKRLSNPGSLYYEFTAEFDSVRFFSEHLGYDKRGNEVRVPRPVTGDVESLQLLRSQLGDPLYVIANDTELLVWRWIWGGTAYLPETLAKANFWRCFDREQRVVENPCLRLVRAKHRLNDPLRKIFGSTTPQGAGAGERRG